MALVAGAFAADRVAAGRFAAGSAPVPFAAGFAAVFDLAAGPFAAGFAAALGSPAVLVFGAAFGKPGTVSASAAWPAFRCFR